MAKRDIHDVLEGVAEQEEALRQRRFIAPCVRGGQVTLDLDGLLYTFETDDDAFEGWGVFSPIDRKRAHLEERASDEQVAEYLAPLLPLRFYLVVPARGGSWLACPANVSDARQRKQSDEPCLVHLVHAAGSFDLIEARRQGETWWFETSVDDESPARQARELRAALANQTVGTQLRISGLTPEQRVAFDLASGELARMRARAAQRAPAPDQVAEQLRAAIEAGGGALVRYHDIGEHWRIEWMDAQGHARESVISKDELTALGSGRGI